MLLDEVTLLFDRQPGLLGLHGDGSYGYGFPKLPLGTADWRGEALPGRSRLHKEERRTDAPVIPRMINVDSWSVMDVYLCRRRVTVECERPDGTQWSSGRYCSLEGQIRLIKTLGTLMLRAIERRKVCRHLGRRLRKNLAPD